MSDFPEGMPLRDAPNVEERFLELIEDSSASQMKGTMQWRPGTKEDPANDANMLSITPSLSRLPEKETSMNITKL